MATINSKLLFFFAAAFLAALLGSCAKPKNILNSRVQFTPRATVASGMGMYKSPQQRPNQDPNKCIGVSISGGGSTSQYFALGVMMGLDEINNGGNSFLKEIDYFSTVSGGGFAAGYYLTLVKNSILSNFPSLLNYWKSSTRKNDFQEYMFIHTREPLDIALKWGKYEKNKIRSKNSKKVRNYPYIVDRELLQYRKNNPAGGTIPRTTLQDFFIPTASAFPVALPMFVANGSIYNNMERLPFMPHIVNDLKITGTLLSPIEPFNGYSFPLCQAIAASSAFPGVLPMAKFEVSNGGVPNSTETIRVMDGGAIDNLGFTTLFELLAADNITNPTPALPNPNKRALVIDCMANEQDPQSQDKKKIKLKGLLKRSLLLSLDANLFNANENIKILAQHHNLAPNNIERVGLHTIKNHLLGMPHLANVQASYEEKIVNANNHKKKLKLYKEFLGTFPIPYTAADDNLIGLGTANFAAFDTKQVFLLYELATHITLRIAIYPWEKDILILAGRYAAYLKQQEIANLLR